MLETSPEITLHIYSAKRDPPTIERGYGVHDLPIHLASLSISYLRRTRHKANQEVSDTTFSHSREYCQR